MRSVNLKAITLFALGMAWTAGAALAQPYPAKPVRLVIPAVPGGGTDFAARVVAQRLGERLNQQFIIENRGGSGGIIGASQVAKSAPDGYTLFLTFPGPLAMAPHAEPVNFDPRKDFVGISMLTIYHLLMASHPSLPVRNARDLIALAKAQPGKLNYASGSLFSPTHLGPELFKMAAGADILSVPYKGTGPGVTAVLVGEAHLIYGSPGGLLPHIRAKRLKGLAVAGPERIKTDPDIPSFADLGIKGADSPSWQALLAPAGTPRDVIMKLNSEIVQLSSQPDYRANFEKQSIDTRSSTPDELTAFLRAEYDKWGKVISAVKRQLESRK